jgi:hypothetical protein
MRRRKRGRDEKKRTEWRRKRGRNESLSSMSVIHSVPFSKSKKKPETWSSMSCGVKPRERDFFVFPVYSSLGADADRLEEILGSPAHHRGSR